MKFRGRGSAQVLALLMTCVLIAESHPDNNRDTRSTCNLSSLDEYCDFSDKHTCNELEGTTALLNGDTARCCGYVQCLYQNTLPDVDCDQAASVSVNLTWFAHDSEFAELLIQWIDPPPESSATDGYQIWIKGSYKTPYFDYTSAQRCSCLPADTRNYRVRVSLLHGWYIHIKLVRLPSPLCIVDTINATTGTVPVNCWDTIGANADKCGVVKPTAPLNLSVTHDILNTTHVMLHVTWSPPERYVSTIKYYEVIIIDMGQEEEVNGTTLQYSTIVGIASSYNIQVRASSGKLSQFSTCTRCWSEPASYQLIFTAIQSTELQPSATTADMTSLSSEGKITATILSETLSPIPTHIATTSGTLPRPNHSSHKALIIGIIVFGVILLVVTSATLMLTVWCWHHKEIYRPLSQQLSTCGIPADNHELPVHCSKSVFIVHSGRCSDEHLRLIRQLCNGLSEYAIKLVAYVYDEISGPPQQGVTQWTTDNFDKCDKVLLVCNKEFSDDWTSKDNTHDSSLVAAARLAFSGCVTKNSNDLSKFAVVLLKELDRKYIPDLVLQNLVKFVYPEHNSNEQIASFIQGTPKYKHPNNLH